MSRFATLLYVLLVSSSILSAQGVIRGRVTSASDGRGVYGATVRVLGTNGGAIASTKGMYTLGGIMPGTVTVAFNAVGFATKEVSVTVKDDDTVILDVVLDDRAIDVPDVVVYSASRAPTKLTEAPAAISVIRPVELERNTSHGQMARSMEKLTGVDVVQSGSNDFNINARGFNNSINRRMLVLIDGRDPSTPLINLNEWNSMSSMLEDIAAIEVVRGPGSALYGQNAYNGVVNIRTWNPEDVVGTRVSLTAGDWQTYRGSLRHAGLLGDNIAYKVSLAASSQYNYSLVSRDTTIPGVEMEYPGLSRDVRGLSEAHRHPFSVVGNARIDYIVDPASRFVLEGGYTASGNEMYVNQTGRLIVQRVEKPYVRAAYNSERLNIQTLWNRRNTPDKQIVYNALAASLETSDVYGVDAQYNNWAMDSTLRFIVGAQAEYQDVNSPLYRDTIGFGANNAPIVETVGLTNPTTMTGRFLGGYGQIEYKPLRQVTFIGAARIDMSNLFDTQFSPKFGVVIEPTAGHSIRATVNRSFLRPSYTDLYRRSPAGAPVILTAVGARIDSILTQRAGRDVSANLGLGTAQVYNLGNPTLKPETAVSFELGYKGNVQNTVFLDASIYYNRRADLISAPLGGLAPNVYPRVRANTGDAALDAVADSLLAAELQALRQDPARLVTFEGAPNLVITAGNIAVVNELGAEVDLGVRLTPELSVNGRYAYIDVSVDENAVATQKILPNTSRHRIGLGATYEVLGSWDVNVDFRYVEGYRWIAGLFEGFVPSYGVLNLSGGYHVLPELRISAQVFNVLDRAHFQIFGGTILRRQASLTATYSF